MSYTSAVRRASVLAVIAGGLLGAGTPAAQPASVPLGRVPPIEDQPRIEFAFEARVTLAPATVVGETELGRRQYIPITGGRVAGPLFNGEVIPGGWDYQLRHAGGCNSLSADYFWRAADGTVIHILNEGLNCAPQAGERIWLRPRFEAPKGNHEWMTRATFVASLQIEPPAAPPASGTPPPLSAIRIRFYQVK